MTKPDPFEAIQNLSYALHLIASQVVVNDHPESFQIVVNDYELNTVKTIKALSSLLRKGSIT